MISILLATFHRDALLRLGLSSIRRQGRGDMDILVLDEGAGEETTRKLCEEFQGQYIWTAANKPSPDHWRTPSFALNVGIRKAAGEIVILSCAEIYHLQTDTIARLVAPLAGDPTALCTCEGRDDKGLWTDAIKDGGKQAIQRAWDESPPLRMELPFLMAMRREHLIAIGGYDEDFLVGQSFDDDDLMDRLEGYGCHYVKTDARCVHLLHQRASASRMAAGRHEHNERLYHERWGIIIRNVGREWGKLPD